MQCVITLLQEWYSDQCNGDWEHSYGIKIDTLDNPGWILRIDLNETEWEQVSIPMERAFSNDHDWMQFQVSNSRYEACGDTSKLIPMINKFLMIVWSNRLTSCRAD